MPTDGRIFRLRFAHAGGGGVERGASRSQFATLRDRRCHQMLDAGYPRRRFHRVRRYDARRRGEAEQRCETFVRDRDGAVRVDRLHSTVGKLGARFEHVEARNHSGREARARIVVRALPAGDGGVGRAGCGHCRQVVDIRLSYARDQSAASFAFAGRRFRITFAAAWPARAAPSPSSKSV